MNESLKWCLDKKRKNFKAKLKIQEKHEEGICFLSKASFFKGVFFPPFSSDETPSTYPFSAT